MSPKISVVMSVYNGERFVREAIDSVLSQTFADFEFVIINDGSTDKTLETLQSYDDPRIQLINNENNLGLTRSLNRGLDRVKGELIARQDADDISNPFRFEKQAAYLEEHKNIGFVGTIAKINNEQTGQTDILSRPAGCVDIRWHMLFNNAFVHTSIMFRRELLRQVQGYNETLACAQDYDLWSRMLNFAEAVNLQAPLVTLRYHEGRISSSNKSRQRAIAQRISAQNIEALLGKKLPMETMESIWHWKPEKGITLDRPLKCRSRIDICALQELLTIAETFARHWNIRHTDLVPRPSQVALACFAGIRMRELTFKERWLNLTTLGLRYPLTPARLCRVIASRAMSRNQPTSHDWSKVVFKESTCKKE